jgi:hypothetical protein
MALHTRTLAARMRAYSSKTSQGASPGPLQRLDYLAPPAPGLQRAPPAGPSSAWTTWTCNTSHEGTHDARLIKSIHPENAEHISSRLHAPISQGGPLQRLDYLNRAHMLHKAMLD